MFITVDKIQLTLDEAGRPIVQREWPFRHHKLSKRTWELEDRGITQRLKEGSKLPKAADGEPFDIRKHADTIDHFVFAWDENKFVHLPTGAAFTSRQLSHVLFRGKAPQCKETGEKKVPSLFLRRFSRIGRRADLQRALEILMRRGVVKNEVA